MVLRPELAGTHLFFCYDQQTGFRLPLVSALLGLAHKENFGISKLITSLYPDGILAINAHLF
jgi:hypothetical protein